MRQQAHVLLEKEILSRMEHPFILKLVQTYQVSANYFSSTHSHCHTYTPD